MLMLRAGMKRATLLLCLSLSLGGCAVQPWVKPYEREHLADPIMSFDRNPISAVYLDHVFEVREGARGATGASVAVAAATSPAVIARTARRCT